jgi:hypothetical protein
LKFLTWNLVVTREPNDSLRSQGTSKGGFHQVNGETMTNLKTLSAIAILAAAVTTPVLAQDAGVFGPTHHGRAYDQRNFRGAHNQLNGPSYATPETEGRRNMENYGFSGMDRSFPGGEDPSLHPSGS